MRNEAQSAGRPLKVSRRHSPRSYRNDGISLSFFCHLFAHQMRTVTRLFLVLALVVIVGLYALSHTLQDFVAYWTAGHLFVARMKPYSLTEMFQAQRALGWPEPVPAMVLRPPWILPLIAPLGLLKSYSAAWLLWVAVLSALLMLSIRLLLSVYDRAARYFDLSRPLPAACWDLRSTQRLCASSLLRLVRCYCWA